MASRRDRAFVLGLFTLFAPRSASAQDRVRFEAKSVTIDPATLRVTLRDRVVIRAGRARVTSDRLTLTLDRDHKTARFEGTATLALCPCPDAPIRFAATSGTLDADGDVTLRGARIEVLGTPVFGLPIVILRPLDKIGLLPPVLAWRADAGFVAGGGVHLPWDKTSWIDARGAGFSKGGGAIEASLVAPWTRTFVEVNVLGTTRVEAVSLGAIDVGRDSAFAGRSIDLGSAAKSRVSAAWDADVIRGTRARSGAIDLDRAAALDDHAAAEIAIRSSYSGASLVLAPGMMMRGERGTGLFFAGPRMSASASFQGFSGSITGAVLGEPGSGLTLPFGRAEVSGEVDARPGPLSLRFSIRGRARAIGVAPRDALDAGGASEAELGLPLVRTFGRRSDGLALTHWITPSVVLRGAGYAARDPFDQLGTPASRVIAPFSGLVAGSLASAIGYWTGPSARVDLRAGALGGSRSGGVRAIGHGRLALGSELFEASGDVAIAGPSEAEAFGAAAIANARVGPLIGPSIGLSLATSAGSGGGAARLVAAGTWAALPTEAYNPFTIAGTTLGMEIVSPQDRSLSGAARLDMDLSPAEGTSPRVLAARALGQYRHPCACWGLSLMFAHRVGRPGIDVMAAVDLGGFGVGAWGGASNALHFPR